MKGPLLECDLLSVSSTDLVLLRHNGDALIFTIGEARKPKMYSPPPDVEEDTLDNLEKQAAQIKTRLEPTAEVPETTKDTDEHYELTIVDPTDELTLNDDGERVIVELDFQDEDGESIQEAVNELMIHDVDVPKSQSRVPLGSTKNGVKEDGKKVTDNSLPVDLEDNEIELGIIYATIEINTFYKKIATLESEIVGYYDILDENEGETRVARLKKITDLSGLLVKRASDELEKIKAEETAIRGQLVRLTTLLTQTETFRENSKDLKYSDIKPDIEKVHTQTRKSIHDVNLELLRLRDRADEVLIRVSNDIGRSTCGIIQTLFGYDDADLLIALLEACFENIPTYIGTLAPVTALFVCIEAVGITRAFGVIFIGEISNIVRRIVPPERPSEITTIITIPP